MLLMKKKFFAAIRAGEKTTTLRFWKRPMVRPGTLRTIPCLGKVYIDEVRAVRWDELTDADARAAGLTDLAALRTALEKLYPPEARGERTLYLVRFRLESSI